MYTGKKIRCSWSRSNRNGRRVLSGLGLGLGRRQNTNSRTYNNVLVAADGERDCCTVGWRPATNQLGATLRIFWFVWSFQSSTKDGFEKMKKWKKLKVTYLWHVAWFLFSRRKPPSATGWMWRFDTGTNRLIKRSIFSSGIGERCRVKF